MVWLVIFGLWYYLRYDDYSRPSHAFWITCVKVTDLALMVYIANYILVPRLLYKKRYAFFSLALIVMILLSSYLKMQIIGRIMNADALLHLTSANLKTRIYDNVIPHFFLVIAGVAAKVMYDHSRIQQQLNVLAKEKAEAELGFLKSQINPHFLFNSLNSVYFLIDKTNEEARNALHQFSDMLRYQLYEMNGAAIPIEKEIRYLQDYVNMQKLRKNENYLIEFEHHTAVNNFSIEPLLLIPFVENAFKHVSHHENGKNFIRINIDRKADQFIFTISNSKEKVVNGEEVGGIGLRNVKRRLELLYPGKHQLNINEDAKLFSVTLIIKIENNSVA